MSQVRRVTPYSPALDEDDGTVAPPNGDGYVTLGVDTYFFPLHGAPDAIALSVTLQTDGTIAGTFSIERTDVPPDKVKGSTAGPGTATDWDDSATSPWVKDDSTVNAFVSSSGTGWTPTALTQVKTAGVGVSIWNLYGRGASRYRLRADITTGGTCRVASSAKS